MTARFAGTRTASARAARTRGLEAAAELAREFRLARRDVGISQDAVERATGHSRSVISRFERGLCPDLPLPVQFELLACVGLVGWVRALPDGAPFRDRAHLEVLAAVRRRVHPGLSVRLEAPLPIRGDRRAWDALITGPDWSVGVEVETRPRDVQAVLRRLALKARDAGVSHLLLVLPATRHNRRLVRLYADELAIALPFPGDRALAMIGAGVCPGGSGLVLLPMPTRLSSDGPIRQAARAPMREGAKRPTREATRGPTRPGPGSDLAPGPRPADPGLDR